jgi:hypothetical protein
MDLTIQGSDIPKVKKNIVDWCLVVPDWFWHLSNDEIASCFNGVGSELTAKPLRKALSYVFDFAFEAVVIHDVIWTYVSVRALSIDDFYASNIALKQNARKCLKYDSGLSNVNPLYWVKYFNCWLAELACNKFGKNAWRK